MQFTYSKSGNEILNEITSSLDLEANDYESQVDVSVEKILEICEFFSANNIATLTEQQELQILSEASCANSLSKIGVENADSIDKKIKKAGKEVADVIKKDGINKESKQKAKFILNRLYDDIADNLKVSFSLKDKKDLVLQDPDLQRSKISQAIMLMVSIIIINTAALIIFSLLFGAPIGNVIMAVIVAPLTEEGAKQIAVRNKMVKEFTIIFNTYEAGSYIVNGVVSGMPIVNMIRGRLICVGMHVTTTIIQWLTHNEKIQKKLGLDSEKDKEKLKTTGNIIGIIIHMTWNSFASFSPKFVNFIMGTKTV